MAKKIQDFREFNSSREEEVKKMNEKMNEKNDF